MNLPTDEDGNLECTICVEPIGILKDDGTIECPVELPCGHTFGDGCLSKWRNTNNVCPNCRAPCSGNGHGTRARATREAEGRQDLRGISRMIQRIVGENPELVTQVDAAEQKEQERNAVEGLGHESNRGIERSWGLVSGGSTTGATSERRGTLLPARPSARFDPLTDIRAPLLRGSIRDRRAGTSHAEALSSDRRAVNIASGSNDTLSRPTESFQILMPRNVPFQRRLSDTTEIPDRTPQRRGDIISPPVLDRATILENTFADLSLNDGTSTRGPSTQVNSEEDERASAVRPIPRDLLSSLPEEENELIDLGTLQSQNAASHGPSSSSKQIQTKGPAGQAANSRSRIEREAHAFEPVGRENALRGHNPRLQALWLHQQSISELYELELMERGLQRGNELQGRQRMARVISDCRRARKVFMTELVHRDVNCIVEVGPRLCGLEAGAIDEMSELHRIRWETSEAIAEVERPTTRDRTRRSGAPSPLSIRETWERMGGRRP